MRKRRASHFAALVLATVITNSEEATLRTPQFVSANGEMCVVIRQLPNVPDFEGVRLSDYTFADSELGPRTGALYRLWPGGHRQLLGEFVFAPEEVTEPILVADDGHFVILRRMGCGESAELLTIRDAESHVVRTLRVRDVLTANDQQWLCRGGRDEVRFSVDDTLRMTMLLAGGKWDAADARQRTIEIDLATGDVEAPERDHCPPALRVTVEADDDLPRHRIARDVVPLTSQALLDRAIVRVMPEYPLVATKARIAGRVGVQLVVGRDGRVESATIVKPLPFGLAEAVEKAMLQWEFSPDVSPVSAVMVFRFEIVRNETYDLPAIH